MVERATTLPTGGDGDLAQLSVTMTATATSEAMAAADCFAGLTSADVRALVFLTCGEFFVLDPQGDQDDDRRRC